MNELTHMRGAAELGRARIEGRPRYRARRLLVLGTMLAASTGLLWRAVALQTEQGEFLQHEGDVRHLREVRIPAHRGMIKDRHGEALAVSTAVDSVWAVPRELAAERERWGALSRLLGLELAQLHRIIAERIDREFVYLKRHVDPDTSAAVKALGIHGVFLQSEYRRYYPTGEIAAHVVGFTDIDDRGQEGMELAFEEWLRGEGGAKHVVQDRYGRFVEDVAQIASARPGHDLTLSLDLRIQSFAYRRLKEAVQRHRARGGSAVVLDVRTGEVLAMANQPSYNPNNRDRRRGAAARNRAVTDVFEPGSTIKPFTIAAALAGGVLRSDSPVDTRPGTLRVGRHLIRDARNLGLIDVATVLKRSSNVGASRIALATPPSETWRVLSGVGFGALTQSGFPGESPGILTAAQRWHELERATIAFGYGLSVTPLQLAQAYAVLANGGRFRPVTLLAHGNGNRSRGTPPPRVVPRPVAEQVLGMLESVVEPDGTGRLARVPGYRVAGKTGTVRKSTPGGYAEDRYRAIFAGLAPVSNPRLTIVVVIDEPQGDEYYGGQVAAPVFAAIAAAALRLLGVTPDGPLVSAGPDSATIAPPSRPYRTRSFAGAEVVSAAGEARRRAGADG